MISLLLWFYARLTRSLPWPLLILALLALPVALLALGPMGLMEASFTSAGVFYDIAFFAALLSGALSLTLSADLADLRPALSPARGFGVQALLASLPPAHLLLALSAEASLLSGISWTAAVAALLPIFAKPTAIVLLLQHVRTTQPLRLGAFLLLTWVLPSVVHESGASEHFLAQLVATAPAQTISLANMPAWHASLASIPPIMAWISAALALAFTTRHAR